jgi:glycogen(starch) synthase
MRIAVVSWEYPPLVVGGLGAHVDGLTAALARAGHEVVVLTRAHPYAPVDEVVEDVRVLRAPTDLPWVAPDNPVGTVASGNHALVGLAGQLDGWRPDVVHAHDWLSAWAGDTLRALWGVPFVATVHATEMGRHQGRLFTTTSQTINAVEWWLTYQAQRVICCSAFMVEEVVRTFQLPPDKVDMIPNGVDAQRWHAPPDAVAPEHPTIVSWGRLEYEKGFQTLLGAVARLRATHPELRAVVVGRGSYADDLHRLAHELGVDDVVRFAGFVPDEELLAMLATAACAVIPSLYEPFGIVALEAMAAGAPLVAAASGGLREVLEHTGGGLLFPPGDVADLADAIRRLLEDEGLRRVMRRAGHDLVATRYSWDAVAAATELTYAKAGATPAGS